MAGNKKYRSWVVILAVMLAIIVDQVIKIAVKTSMPLGDGFSVLGEWFQIRFVENNGMAFGIELFNKLFLTGFRVLAVCFLVYILFRLVKNIKYPLGFLLSVAMILAGAVGNIIDCVFYGEIFSSSYGQVASFVPWGEGYGTLFEGRVVDMFYFADACISCSVAVMILFYRKYVVN